VNKEKKTKVETKLASTVKPLGATLTECGCNASASCIDKKKDTSTSGSQGVDVDADF